ncbi:MAG: NADH-quinone oxidoreductase subunit M [Gammaproteobacteria bacterium]|nr:NADH-quinone oxidoreductase subunit M [Gammaproteobacteria bacterium]
MLEHSLLSTLIWFPILAGVAVLAFTGDKHPRTSKILALASSVITLILCSVLYHRFDMNTALMQFQENYTWIPAYAIRYTLGVDGISMPMIVLTCYINFLVLLASWHSIKQKISQYLAAFLIMQGVIVGVFAALDAMLFYVFWESMLIPMYLCIGMWGSNNRFYASIKFFLYTFFGSALMLVALIYLGFQAHSFSILDFYSVKLAILPQLLIFFAFLLAFAVKVPMFPVHTWLPDAHTEAPAGGSAVLAAIMLKIGAYGFLRFSLPIVPDACRHLDWLMITLSLFAVIYIGFVAIVQKDMKRLIAYSSIAHMGFVTLGCFAIYRIVQNTGSLTHAYMSIEGALVQMISHGFTSAAMFFGVGVLYHQLHTRLIRDYGGVANKMPIFAALFMVFAMGNVGLPGTSGFVGEFMVVLSVFQASPWISLLATSTVVLSAAYTLWMYKRVFYGKIINEKVNTLIDLDAWDKLVFVLLALTILLLGVYPQPLLNIFHPTVEHLLSLSMQSKL